MADAPNRDHLAWLRQIAYDPALTPFAVRVAVGLTRYFNRETGEAFPSQETLAADLSATADGVRKAIGNLENAGHLQVARGRGRHVSSRYRPLSTASKTPTAVLDLGSVIPDGGSGMPAANNPDGGSEKPRQPSGKTPTAVRPNPLMKPLDEPPENGQPDGGLFGDDGGAGRKVVVLASVRRVAASKRRETKAQLPDDWSPPEDAYDFGAGLGLTAQDVEAQTAQFRDHALANNRRQADWTAAWRNWLRKAADWKSERLGRQTASRGGFSALDIGFAGEID